MHTYHTIAFCYMNAYRQNVDIQYNTYRHILEVSEPNIWHHFAKNSWLVLLGPDPHGGKVSSERRVIKIDQVRKGNDKT